MDALVSIIVPVYKVEKYLDRCVQSLINQTYKNLEIILVDDGSPDTCGKMCDGYAQKDKRIKVIHKQNGGMSSARNAGLDIAKGEYLAFVDSDDWVHENFIQTLFDKLKEHKADVVCCSVIDMIENTGEEIPNIPVQSDTAIKGTEILKKYYENYTKILTVVWNKIYKREMFEKLRYPVGRIYEDASIILNILSSCEKIVIIPDPLYFYRKREDSIMRSKVNALRVDSIACNLEEHVNFLIDIGREELLNTEITNRFCDFGWLYRTADDREMKKYIKQVFAPLHKKYKKYTKLKNMKSVKMLINLLYMKLF